jgi:hypothetical protein
MRRRGVSTTDEKLPHDARPRVVKMPRPLRRNDRENARSNSINSPSSHYFCIASQDGSGELARDVLCS